MFISLNRKIIYTIASLFIISCSLFIYTFYVTYGENFLLEGKVSLYNYRQQAELQQENLSLKQELRDFSVKYPEHKISEGNKKIISQKDSKTLQQTEEEKKKIEQTIKNYNRRYSAFNKAFLITIAGLVSLIIIVGIVGILLNIWIINPIEKLTRISQLVSKGDLSKRIDTSSPKRTLDEIDHLSQTFNQMIDALNQNIQEIKKREKFQQALINSIPDGIRVIDQNYNIILTNKSYDNLVEKKFQQPEKCYTSCNNFNAPCPTSTHTCPLKEIKKNRKNIKVIQEFQSGKQNYLSINAAHMKNLDNGMFYIVESIRDLSEDIRFSHQQKLSSLGFLSTALAHEMKNNLGAIRMILENLTHKYFSNKEENELSQYINLIYNQILETIKVPERLLKLARTSDKENGQINCHESILEIKDLLDYEAKSKGVLINYHSKLKAPQIRGNETDFKMILLNLLQNAIKAIKDTGTINIKLSKSKQKLRLEIADNGIGIAEEKIPHLFEPFFSENKKDGTGLGLAIVKSLTEKMHGKISVESQLGKGTTFVLEFNPASPQTKITKK